MGASATYRFVIAILLYGTFPSRGFAVTAVQPEVMEEIARAKLDKKLMEISQSNEMRVKQHPETNPNPQLLDPDSGNPTKSRMAFHDRVVPTCLQWAQTRKCDKWLAPYVSEHGVEGGADSSDLEDTMGKAWQQYSGQAKNNPLAIFDVEKAGGGQVLDRQGRMDLTGVSKFALKQEVRSAVDQLGYQNAQMELSQVPLAGDGAKSGNTSDIAQPNEVYRAMARDWTQMLRNRLVAKLGQQRAATKEGGEAITDFDMPECDQYFEKVSERDSEQGNEFKLKEQVPLYPETKRKTLDQRYQMCMKMRNASIFEQTKGNKKGGEPIDQALTRINIAMIDNAGLDPNEAPKPANLAFQREDYASLIADCTPNGKGCNGVLATNAEQINSFNNARAEAWQSIQDAAKRSGNINPDGYKKLKEKIAMGPGAQSLVQLNGMTAEMKGELKGKEFVQKSGMNQEAGPDNVLERTPAQLVVKSLQ